MGNRTHTFAVEEYYHCFNRGVDKRVTFADAQDFNYFISSLKAYNSIDSYGKLRLHYEAKPQEKLVDVVSFCLLPNHYHIVLKERVENGISNFMKRVGTGYTLYFNKKNKRSGSLFQGAFKSKYIGTDQDLRQVIAYVTHNYQVHNITDKKLYRSELNKDLDIVRGFTSNNLEENNLKEIVAIIKELRLSYD